MDFDPLLAGNHHVRGVFKAAPAVSLLGDLLETPPLFRSLREREREREKRRETQRGRKREREREREKE